MKSRNNRKKLIYMDYAATTPADKRSLKIAEKYFIEIFGNPSSNHQAGRKAEKGVVEARKKIAHFFECQPKEIIFTSGGTEGENLVTKGFAFSNKKNGSHIITSSVEHNAVSSGFDFLKKRGFKISKLKVDEHGFIDINDLFNSIRDETILISIMYVNNELGTIQPIKKIGAKLKKLNKKREVKGLHKISFHTDAEAAGFYLDCNVDTLGVDLMVINSSKMYSLKGTSAVYVRKGTKISTQITGGGQERMLRGGTENVPSIVSFGESVKLAQTERVKNNKKVSGLKNLLITKISKNFPDAKINTPPKNSICNILHVTFKNDKNKNLIKKLSEMGICVSMGSACAGNQDTLPHVPQEIGLTTKEIKSSIRISLGKNTTKKDIIDLINAIKTILKYD